MTIVLSGLRWSKLMNNVNTNLFCKEIGTDMFAGQFMGYWILVGENEKGLIYK